MKESKLARYIEWETLYDNYDVIIHTDGGSRENDSSKGFGAGAYSYVVVKGPPDKSDMNFNDGCHAYFDKYSVKGRYCTGKSNNETELMAISLLLSDIIKMMERFPEYHNGEVTGTPYTFLIRCDSELSVKFINGDYNVKEERLKPIVGGIQQTLSHIREVCSCHVKWLPREYNLADVVCNFVMDFGESIQYVHFGSWGG
jgi:ribonuclease HI